MSLNFCVILMVYKIYVYTYICMYSWKKFKSYISFDINISIVVTIVTYQCLTIKCILGEGFFAFEKNTIKNSFQ